MLGPLLAVGLGCAGLGGSSELDKLSGATHTLSGGESLAPVLLKGLWQTPEGFLRSWVWARRGREGPACFSDWNSGAKGAVQSWPSPFSPDSFSQSVVFFSQNLNSPSVLKTWQGCAPIGYRIIWIFCPGPAHRVQHDGDGPAPPTPPPHLCIYFPPPPCSSASRAHPSPAAASSWVVSCERPPLPALPSTSRVFPSSSLSGHLVSFPLWSSPWFIIETLRLLLVCFSRLPFPQGVLKSLEGQSRHTVLFLSLNPLPWRGPAPAEGSLRPPGELGAQAPVRPPRCRGRTLRVVSPRKGPSAFPTLSSSPVSTVKRMMVEDTFHD